MNLIIQFFNFIPLYSLLFGCGVVCRISNQRKCADSSCSQPLSMATSLLQYVADDDRLLSFPRNIKAKIYSKEAGDNPSLWEAEEDTNTCVKESYYDLCLSVINGKRGYVPKDLFKETKLFVKKADVNVIVSTGRDDRKENITENKVVQNNDSSTFTINDTPSLPLPKSKGLFGMMEGVSADSVPPNSPEISPQTTRKYEVFDGTTVYDDPAITVLDKPPDIVTEVKQTPPLEQPPARSSKINDPLESISSLKNNVKPKLVEGKKEAQEDPYEASVKGAEKTNKNQKPETQANNNVRQFAEKIIEDPHSVGANFVESSAEMVSENQKPFESSKNNIRQEVIEGTKQDITIRAESHETLDNSGDITKEKTTGVFDNIVTRFSSLISSGTGAEEISEENEEEMLVSVEDSGSGDIEETTQEENGNEKNLDIPVNKAEEKHTQAKQQPFKVQEDASDAPNVSIKPNLEQAVKTASSVPEKSPDKYEEEASQSGISDSEDEEYLSGEKFQEVSSKAEIVEESAVNSKVEKHFVFNTSSVSDKKQEVEEPVVLLAIPVETDTPGVKPVPSEKPISVKVEQSPLTETKTSKPIDILRPAEVNITEPSSEKDKVEELSKETAPIDEPKVVYVNENEPSSEKDKVEELSKETAPIDEPKVAYVNENEISIDSFTEPEIALTSLRVNTTDSGLDIDPEEYLMKPVHEEPESESISEKEVKKNVQTDFSDKTYDLEIDVSKEQKNLYEETISSGSQVDVEFDKPEMVQIPSVPSIPPPIQNILSFQHSSQLPPTYSPVVDDSLVVPAADGASEEVKGTLEESFYPSTVTEAGFTTDVQNEENVGEDTQEPIIDHPQSDQSEDEVNVFDITSTLPEEPFPESKQEEPSEGILSLLNPVFDMFSSFQSQSQDIEQVSVVSDELPLTSEHLDPFHISKLKEESCLADGLGEEACEALKNIPNEASQDGYKYTCLYSTDISSALELLEKIPLETTVWLIITAVVVLIFSLGHYYIEAHRRDGPLVAIINKLEREVLILKKESSILDDRLHTAQEQLEAWNTNSSENDALIVELKEELEKIRAEKTELEEQVGVLEREVESATESGLEMHRLFSESLSSQDGSQVLLSTVETLREKLEHQEDEIANLSQSLSQKDIELEELKEKLAKAKDVAAELENKVIDVVRQKDEEALELKEKHRLLIVQLEEVMETKALDETRVSMEMSKLHLAMNELQKCLAERDSELEEVKEVVKELRSTDSNEKMDALFDVVGVRAQLKQAATDRDTFREKFHEEEGARKLLEGHMKKITQEVSELKNNFETAEKEKIEALTKLQVLSNYFKEKESQLQKELGLQESMWLHKQSEDHSIYEQMRSLREENEKYKLQNESLKKEIVEQEASFKIQVANVEQKAHENWVTSRQAERRLKEVQQEAAQLRNKLTMEKSNFSLDDSKPNLSETNGDPSSPPPSLIFPPTTSPPFMMYPHMAPPGDFIPPPPLTGSPFPSDSRPPPLGRISSPPLDHRFSPPPPLPYPPYDYPPYGHHSPSPPPPLPPPQSHHRNVHKPQPREMSREQKDHSNYSPETDKPMRRKKR